MFNDFIDKVICSSLLKCNGDKTPTISPKMALLNLHISLRIFVRLL